MHLISASSGGHAWKESVKIVLSDGKAVKDGDKNLTELINVVLDVKCPTKVDEVINKYGDKKMIEWMYDNFLSNKPVANWGYSYGQRLTDYKGINQLENIITKLKSNPEAKSATAILMYPPMDQKHVPCIVALDFKIREDKLISSAFFRSQDAGKKVYADILSLGKIMEKIAKELGVEVGNLTIFIASLHIYEDDKEKLNNLISLQSIGK